MMNKKRIILSICFSLLLIGLVVAGDFIVKEKVKKVKDADELKILEDLSLDNYLTEDFETNTGFERCIYREIYGIRQKYICLTGKTIAHLDLAEDDLIKGLIEKEMNTKNKIGEGNTIWIEE